MDNLKQIGKYQIVAAIGKGGMGYVYKAIDPIIERNVAIKMMKKDNFENEIAVKRFFREAKAIGQLQHPNIIIIHDAGEHNQIPYLVVEYCDGTDLSILLKTGNLPPTNRLLSIMIDVCNALDYAHQQGIVHRDIKPANIFYLKTGQVKLMDFGIAKVEDSVLTKSGMFMGTVHYMSPEQINGKNVDYLTDIYSLGIVIFELFSQKLPFDGNILGAILSKILLAEPVPFEPVDVKLPRILKQIILKTIAKNKSDRYQSAAELALDLAKVKIAYEQNMISGQLDDFSGEGTPDIHEKETIAKQAKLPADEIKLHLPSSTKDNDMKHSPLSPAEPQSDTSSFTRDEAINHIKVDELETKIPVPEQKSDEMETMALAEEKVDDQRESMAPADDAENELDTFALAQQQGLALEIEKVTTEEEKKDDPILTADKKEKKTITPAPKKDITSSKPKIIPTIKVPRTTPESAATDDGRKLKTRTSVSVFLVPIGLVIVLLLAVFYGPVFLSKDVERTPLINQTPDPIQNTRMMEIEKEWQKTKQNNSVESYQAFINSYASDPLAIEKVGQARKKVTALEQTLREHETIASEWQQVLNSYDKVAYKSFIEKYSSNPLAEKEVVQAKKDLAAIIAREKNVIARKKEINKQWQKTLTDNNETGYLTFAQKYHNDPLAKNELVQAQQKLATFKKKRLENKIIQIKSGKVMQLVKGGTFQMGDKYGEGNDDEMLHTVTINDFYISSYEVTFAEFDAFCAAMNRTKPADVGFGREIRPVIQVSWYDAVEYCNWLSLKKGLKPCYTINKSAPDPNNKSFEDELKWTVAVDATASGYRLPTEAEWEYSARQRGQQVRYGNGNNTATEREINFNNKSDSVRADKSRPPGTTPVGSFPSNSIGLYDMSGNVWEWCWDWYGEYDVSSSKNPTGPAAGDTRVLRGGSWIILYPTYVRAANRSSMSPLCRDHDIGFRLVRSP
ncbi:bifunctional serine/threonine-protein kinase/formylglycine-generating enzyme family protein [candidate division CSSED10-310 bacterium]|uniref:Bifunctional serine/threonine-protein kinase/formylglycine-generating enzyme family protein n=1 Tax=candidate division CSSED10-310 bacterium TaxID=2855610 RepID=A0ABV6Z1L2_UNCC1